MENDNNKYDDALLVKSIYRERFNKICYESKLDNFLNTYEHGGIPESINLMEYAEAALNFQSTHYYIPHWEKYSPTNITTRCFMSYFKHNVLVYEAGFCTVAMNWVRKLVEYMKKLSNRRIKNNINVLEICAGLGTLSKALNIAGIEHIEAVDDYSDIDVWNLKEGTPFYKVKNLDMFNALDSYKNDYYHEKFDFVICAWPRLHYPLKTFMEKLNEIDENTIFIYIGDARGGCCANDEFFDNVKPVLDINDYKSIEELYPDWSPWIKDSNEIIRFYKYSDKGILN